MFAAGLTACKSFGKCSLHAYADRIVVLADGQVTAKHRRRFDRRHDGGRTVYDWRHDLSVLQRQPGALLFPLPGQR